VLSMVFFASGCEKEYLKDVSLNIVPKSLVIDLKDSLSFSFTGDADVISFYSGEPGKEYKYRNRTVLEGAKLRLTIASRVLYGSQENNLKLMCSSKFAGNYSAVGIKDEEWKDMTKDFTWSTAGPNAVAATTTTSGPVEITKYIEPGKPIYFGYRYESWSATAASLAGRSWRLPTFDLELISADGTTTKLTSVTTAGWKKVPIIGEVSYWTVSNADPYLWFTPNSTLIPHLHWVVSSPFDPSSVKPDKATVLKKLIDPAMSNFKYKFNKKGVYTVTFVAKNVNYQGEHDKVQEFEVTVQ